MTITQDRFNTERRALMATYVVIGLFALLHLVLAGVIPIAKHETHYALYARHLDLSYVDHPPLTGWLQWLVISLSSADYALRIVPLAILTVTQVLLAILTRRLFPDESPWVAFLCILMVQGMIVTHGAITMLPEVPLMLLSVLCVWATWRLLRADTWSRWLTLAMVLGLAGLAKYTAMLLAISVVTALVLAGNGRRLIQPKAWAAAALALLLVSPVLIWNWQNDWISFAYQLGYQLDTGDEAARWSLAAALNYQGEQLLIYSPLVFFGGLAAIIWALRSGTPETRLLLVFALPFLVVFAVFAGVGRAKLHWTYVGWLLLTPLIARWLVALWSRRSVRVLSYVSAIYSTMLILLALVGLLPSLKLPDFVHPLASLAGWEEVTRRAVALRDDMPEAKKPPILMVRNWHHAGPVTWYAYPDPVYDYRNRHSQYTEWYGELPKRPRGILIAAGKADPPEKDPHPKLDCELAETVPVHYGVSLLNRFYLYRCEPR